MPGFYWVDQGFGYALAGNLPRERLMLLALPFTAGLVLAARLDSAQPSLGTSYELDAIAAVVIGGASLFGGSGTILGTVAGAFVIAVIQYGLVFINVEPFWQFISVGVVIIISVLIDQAQRRISGGRQSE